MTVKKQHSTLGHIPFRRSLQSRVIRKTPCPKVGSLTAEPYEIANLRWDVHDVDYSIPTSGCGAAIFMLSVSLKSLSYVTPINS